MQSISTAYPNAHPGSAILLAAFFAPELAYASGDPKAVAIFLMAIVVLHAASIASGFLLLLNRWSWPVVFGAIAVGTLAAIGWYFGFLEVTGNPSLHYHPSWFWIWSLMPILLLALSCSRALQRKFSKSRA